MATQENIFDFVLEYRLNGDKSGDPRRRFNFVFDVPEEGTRMKVLDQAGKHGEKLLNQHLGFDVGAFNVFCVYAV